jgi:hypothetical protein
LQPTRPAAFTSSKLCHHGVAGHAAEPRAVGRTEGRGAELAVKALHCWVSWAWSSWAVLLG